jgi:hypothetical protein
MDLIAEAAGSVDAATALGGTALTLAAAAYTNAKFGIKTDIDSLRDERAFGTLLGQRIAQMGDTCTVYKLLERVIEVDGKGAADALWFENKTWSYSQVKDCECCSTWNWLWTYKTD